jgi:hypothetical protein
MNESSREETLRHNYNFKKEIELLEKYWLHDAYHYTNRGLILFLDVLLTFFLFLVENLL